MQVGSLVICIESCLGLNENGISRGEIIPVDSVLTVRLIRLSTIKRNPIIYFEEINNPICNNTGKEFGYPVRKFRELMPPISIESLTNQFELEHIINL